MQTDAYSARLDRCRAAMKTHGLDTLVLTPGAAMQYLTGFDEPGFERLICLIVPQNGSPLFIAPSLNAEHAKTNPAGISDIRAWTDNEGWEPLLRRTASELQMSAGCVAVDENMGARFLLPLQGIVPSSLTKTAGPLFARLRSVKDENELAAMQRAADLTDRAYHAALAVCKPGVTEAELARVIHETMIEAGGEPGFESIVGSGPNSALPHYRAGQRQIREGEIVLFDLGARLDGYCGDITRVVSIGPPSEKESRIYDIVYRAYSAAVEAARPGAPASFVDHVARQLIADEGYGELFFHRTGHGIGLEDHEHPNIVHGNDTPLEPGNCFSVEPGIYLAGEFGVRLENIVTVTADGRRVLNEAIPPRLMDITELVDQ